MISICIIVKNDPIRLEECLKHACAYQFEIIIVDTGSIDNTKEVARKYTSHVYDFTWCDDFSAARNFCISKASNDFVLILDSDEYIINLHKKELLQLIKTYPQAIGKIQIQNKVGNENTYTISNVTIDRIFNRKHYYYMGSIHEQVLSRGSISPCTYIAPVTVSHVGYYGSKEYMQEKVSRNMQLLEQSIRQNGGTAYDFYQYGKCYYALSDYKTAIPIFEQSLALTTDLQIDFVEDLVECYGYSLLFTNQFAQALTLEAVTKELKDSADFLFLLGLIYQMNQRFEQAIKYFLGATRIPQCKTLGHNSFLAYYHCGLVYEQMNDSKSAISYYEKCNKYPPAMEGLLRCKDQ